MTEAENKLMEFLEQSFAKGVRLRNGSVNILVQEIQGNGKWLEVASFSVAGLGQQNAHNHASLLATARIKQKTMDEFNRLKSS